MWKLEYSYDGTYIGDLFPITQTGVSWGKQRNTVKDITFSLSIRALTQWCNDRAFDTTRFFTPQKSTVQLVNYVSDSVQGKVVGGWLSRVPPFSLGSQADAILNCTFTSWLGLTAGAYLKPPLTYNDNFNDVATAQMQAVIERTFLAGALWQITPGISDVLPVVSDTLDAPKRLMDFLLERADNTEGTGTFDVYDDPDGVITLYEKYGTDLSASYTFEYPDVGGQFGIKNIEYPEWDNYISDMFLTGAGNGYASTSGAEGAAIYATAYNQDTRDTMGYWEYAASESDITSQTVLDDKATSYVRDTDKPFVIPGLTIDGDLFKLYAHELGGNLWVGDTVMVNTSSWAKEALPLETPVALRIDSINGTVDKFGHCSAVLGMVADA